MGFVNTLATVEVRRFSDTVLQAQIERVLAQVPPEKPVAVVAHADLQGASLSAFVRVADQWSVMVAAYKPYNGSLSAEAQVVWTP